MRSALDEFDETLFGRGKKHVEGFDVRVQAEFLELGQDPFGIVFIVRRADVMRMRGKPLHISAKVGRIRRSAKFLLPVAFGV